MKHSLISTLVALVAVLCLFLSFPAATWACGGGGGGGGEGRQPGESSDDLGLPGGASGLSGFVFIDPSSTGEMSIAGGTIDINNIPEYTPLTPRERMEMQERINRSEAAFWTAMGHLAHGGEVVSEVAAFGGKAAGWVLAFTPAGLPVKIAIASVRGAADGYAASVEKGDGKEASQAAFSGIVAGTVEGVTSAANPLVGIVAGEVAGNLSTSDAPNRAPGPNIGDMAMEQAKVTRDPYTGREFAAPVYR